MKGNLNIKNAIYQTTILVSILVCNISGAFHLQASANGTNSILCSNQLNISEQLTDVAEGFDVDFACLNGNVDFEIHNVGNQSTGDFILSIVEDDVILFVKTYNLEPGNKTKLSFPKRGEVYKTKIELNNTTSIDTFSACPVEDLRVTPNPTNINSSTDLDYIIGTSNIQNVKIGSFFFDGNDIQIVIEATEARTANLLITDIMGNPVTQIAYNLIEGENAFQLDMSQLNNGRYQLSLLSGNEMCTAKWMVAK